MRKILILALMLSFLTTALIAQTKNKKASGDLDKPKTTLNKAAPEIDYSVPKVDTIKVVVDYYGESASGLQYIGWLNGYVIRTTKFEEKSKVTQDEISQLVVAPNGKVGVNKVVDMVYDDKFKTVPKVQSVSVSNW